MIEESSKKAIKLALLYLNRHVWKEVDWRRQFLLRYRN